MSRHYFLKRLMDNKEDSATIYKLTLYITGASPNSARAVSNIRSICTQYLPGRFELHIVDVYQQQGIAQEDQIVALPLLVKHFPLPEKKFIGNMSDTKKVLRGLEIENNLDE